MQQKLALKEQCEGEWFLHEHDILEKKKHLDTKISNHFIQPKVRCHSQIMTSSADLTVAKRTFNGLLSSIWKFYELLKGRPLIIYKRKPVTFFFMSIH